MSLTKFPKQNEWGEDFLQKRQDKKVCIDRIKSVPPHGRGRRGGRVHERRSWQLTCKAQTREKSDGRHRRDETGAGTPQGAIGRRGDRDLPTHTAWTQPPARVRCHKGGPLTGQNHTVHMCACEHVNIWSDPPTGRASPQGRDPGVGCHRGLPPHTPTLASLLFRERASSKV